MSVSSIRSSSRASATVIALVIAVLAVAAWFLVVAPKRAHVSTLKADVAAANTQLTAVTQAAAVSNRKAAAAAELAAPDLVDQPEILDQLNRLGAKNKVVIATVAPNLATTLTAGVVPLTLTVDGTYFQIRNFLNQLRNQVQVGKAGRISATGRLYDVQSVDIATGAPGGKLSATIAVNAAMYTPALPAPAAAAPTGSTG